MTIVQCAFGGIAWDMIVKCEEKDFDVPLFEKLFEAELSNQETVMKFLDSSRVAIDFGEGRTAVERAFLDMGVEAMPAKSITVNLN